MGEKIQVDLKNVTMQSLIFNPFLLLVSDETKSSGVNAAVISYVGVVCESPPVIGLAIRPARLSHQLILKAREFTLSLPTVDLLRDYDFCGTYSGRKVDKIKETELELESSGSINTPGLKRSPLILECRLREVMELSLKRASHDYFVADVVAVRRSADFRIENHEAVVTTNYDYRQVGPSFGRAFKIHKVLDKGG
jgi:flavin reductase (DIM6/NTAB) family NADH-FMN oxidoreductase RutF